MATSDRLTNMFIKEIRTLNSTAMNTRVDLQNDTDDQASAVAGALRREPLKRSDHMQAKVRRFKCD